MKRVLVFIILVFVIDRGLGAALQRLNAHNLTGDRGGNLNCALTRDADILVLGSSRAQFQIEPSLLNQQLQGVAYNAGLKGQDFLYSVMLFDLWQRRHKLPRAVVMTIELESLAERDTEVSLAQIVAPYLAESPLVQEVLYTGSPFKRFEYLSHAYRFNGETISIARHVLSHPPPGFDGYSVAPGQLNPADQPALGNALDGVHSPLELARLPFSERKLRYLSELANTLARGGSRLFLLHTPLFRHDPIAHALWQKRLNATLATLPKVELIDICQATHPELFTAPTLYRDLNHVNVRGAAVLTTLLGEELHQRLAEPAPR